MNPKKYLIVGLGNAEQKYAGTRHNIGFEVVNSLAKKMEVVFTSERYAYKAEAKYKGRTLVLIMPTTYMNLSGNAVRYWMEKEEIEPQNILVISDDIDLPIATLRMRPKGGGGSHNGINHIIEILQHQNFPRLRFGIGKNYPQGMQVEYVLNQFLPEEQEQITATIEKATDACLSFCTAGLQRTMEAVNRVVSNE
ncbi:MAG: aminoacyl-tRNA hydrolase [Bacteroidales bacterium]|jgi:PTH1 family peptidyl-tRNA hydrolase|nr:aminoacyl-tRNA hydrolase [Bacteroidales bacterium]